MAEVEFFCFPWSLLLTLKKGLVLTLNHGSSWTYFLRVMETPGPFVPATKKRRTMWISPLFFVFPMTILLNDSFGFRTHNHDILKGQKGRLKESQPEGS